MFLRRKDFLSKIKIEDLRNLLDLREIQRTVIARNEAISFFMVFFYLEAKEPKVQDWKLSLKMSSAH